MCLERVEGGTIIYFTFGIADVFLTVNTVGRFALRGSSIMDPKMLDYHYGGKCPGHTGVSGLLLIARSILDHQHHGEVCSPVSSIKDSSTSGHHMLVKALLDALQHHRFTPVRQPKFCLVGMTN